MHAGGQGRSFWIECMHYFLYAVGHWLNVFFFFFYFELINQPIEIKPRRSWLVLGSVTERNLKKKAEKK